MLKARWGEIPSLEEVAEVLGETPESCRSIVHNLRKREEISWSDLGIQTGRVTEERAILGAYLNDSPTPRSRAFLISRILTLAREQKISPRQATILVFAFYSGQSLYHHLDEVYGRLVGMDPHQVSGFLHSTVCKGIQQPGALGEITSLILDAVRNPRPSTPQMVRRRELFSQCITFLRSDAEERPLEGLLRVSSRPIEVTNWICLAAKGLFNREWPPELTIAPSHCHLIRELLTAKAVGTYTSMHDFARQVDLDQSGIIRALTGDKKRLGIKEKLTRGGALLKVAPTEALQAAAQALHKSKKLSQSEIDVLENTVAAIKTAQQIPTKNEKIVCEELFTALAHQSEVVTTQIAQNVGLSESATYHLLYGNAATQDEGIIRKIDTYLRNFPADIRKEHAVKLFPLCAEQYHYLLRDVANLTPLSHSNTKRKQHIAAHVASIVPELSEPPTLNVTVVSRSGRTERPLQPHELASMIEGYFITAHGDFSQVANQLGLLAGTREDLQASKSKIRRLLIGRHEEEGERLGAISRLEIGMKGEKEVLALLAQTPDESSLSEEVVQRLKDNWESLDWASRILQAGSGLDAIRLAQVWCVTREHTLRELVRAALRESLLQRDLPSAVFYREVLEECRQEDMVLSDSVAARLLQKVYAHLTTTHADRGPCRITPLAYAAFDRGVKVEHASTFLLSIHQSASNTLVSTWIDEWRALAYTGKWAKHEWKQRHYARRVYERFCERAFGGVLERQELTGKDYSYESMCSLAGTRAANRSAEENRIRDMISSFFATYSLEAVVTRYCSKFLQSPSNPRGVSFDFLIEVANDAVYDSARRYAPQSYLESGRKVAAFATVAINTIRWACLNRTQEYMKDNEKIAASLDAPINPGADGATLFGTLIPESCEEPDLEQSLMIERIRLLLTTLEPVRRRIVELKFGLTHNDSYGAAHSLEEIAEILFAERLTPDKLNPPHVRYLLGTTLLSIRSMSFGGSPESWSEFFTKIKENQAPEPLLVKRGITEINICPGVSFTIPHRREGRTESDSILSVEKVFSTGTLDWEVLVRVRDIKSLESLALYVVTIERGSGWYCERVE